MGPKIVALGLGINADYPGLSNRGMAGLFETIGGVFTKALHRFGFHSHFVTKNDMEVEGKKVAGLSASAETGKSLLFHTSLLVDFDIELMIDIMNTPLIKLYDKGYNCFSQRMTTVRQEVGRNDIRVEEVMAAIQDAFEETFGIRFREDAPDEWEQAQIRDFIENRYTRKDWIFSHKHPRSRMGIGRLKTKGGLLEIYLSLAGGSIENVVITGDFFSTTKDVNCLEKALKWTSARPEKIEEHLSEVWRDEMIYGLDVPTLTKAILIAKENQVRL